MSNPHEAQPVADAFGELLWDARRRCGLTQREVAERSGVTRTSVAMYETGRDCPSLPAAVRLAAVLGIDMNVVVGATAATDARSRAYSIRSG